MAERKKDNLPDEPIVPVTNTESGMADDPVSRYLIENWKNLLFTVLAVVAVIYGKNRFDEASENRLATASSLFSNVQNLYQEIEGMETGDEKEKKKTSLREMIIALEDARSPYNHLAPLYASLIDVNGTNLNVANDSDLKNADSELIKLATELKLLAMAKHGLDSEGTRQQATARLEKLAAEATFVKGAAQKSVELIK